MGAFTCLIIEAVLCRDEEIDAAKDVDSDEDVKMESPGSPAGLSFLENISGKVGCEVGRCVGSRFGSGVVSGR